MGKELSEMSLKELWQLFPIFLTEHNTFWSEWFQDEKSILEKILPQNQIARISHVGSTFITNIWAKPIVDILMEISVHCRIEEINSILIKNGYTCMSQSKDRISYNKGYTKNGFAKRVFHLHLRYTGDNDELYFRDYLVEHKEIAFEYEKLKLELWKKYEYNRDAYTNAKTEFVARYTQEAKRIYGNKYC